MDSRRTTPICRGDHNLKQAGRRRQMPFAGISGSFGSHWGTGLRPALVGGHPNRPLEGGVAPSHGVSGVRGAPSQRTLDFGGVLSHGASDPLV